VIRAANRLGRYTLDERVRRELERRYPADRAIGFAAGDIRGCYWVELPKPAATVATPGS